jgi:hypothetical protein
MRGNDTSPDHLSGLVYSIQEVNYGRKSKMQKVWSAFEIVHQHCEGNGSKMCRGHCNGWQERSYEKYAATWEGISKHQSKPYPSASYSWRFADETFEQKRIVSSAKGGASPSV